MIEEWIVTIREFLTVSETTKLIGATNFETFWNIFSLPIIYLPILASIFICLVYMLAVGFLTGSKKNRTISSGNYWLIITGLIFQVLVIFAYMGFLMLIK